MEALLIRYGLIAVFIGAAFEGDVIFILAGVVAHLGLLDLPTSIMAGALGACGRDCVWYWFGRFGGAHIHGSRAYRRAEAVADRLARRFGPWELLAARPVFGAQIASDIVWGIRSLSFGRFVLIDLIACMTWASAITTMGWLLSHSAMLLIGEVVRIEIWLLGALLLSVAMSLIFRMIFRRVIA
jgi:membrane protein DedA with SNARE-associated domain